MIHNTLQGIYNRVTNIFIKKNEQEFMPNADNMQMIFEVEENGITYRYKLKYIIIDTVLSNAYYNAEVIFCKCKLECIDSGDSVELEVESRTRLYGDIYNTLINYLMQQGKLEKLKWL